MTVTHRATLGTLRQPIGLRNTLITVASGNQSLTDTFSRVNIATGIINRTQSVTRTSLTTVRIALVKAPESLLALIAPPSVNVLLAMTRSGLNSVLLIGNRITDAVIQRTPWIAIARLTHVRTLDVLQWIPIEERRTLLAVITLSIVLAVIANASAHATRVFVHCLIKVAACGMIVTVALCGIILHYKI